MKTTKYALIYFLDPNDIIPDIQRISEMDIRKFFVSDTNIFVFSSTMTIDELYTYFDVMPEGRLFFLLKYSKEDLRISLPQRIIDFLDSEEVLGDEDQTFGIIVDDGESDMSEITNDGVFEGVIELGNKELTAAEYVAKLSPSEKDSLYESILNKLPNVSDWEAKLLIELEE